MSVQSIGSQVSSEELYVLRKKQEQVQQAEQTEQAAEQLQVQQVQVDEYDKANPVGEEVEGVYSVSHDESGNLKVDYKPTAKSEAKAQAQQSVQTDEAEAAEEGQEGQAAQSGGVQAASSDDDDDDELEELEQKRDALKQQLNRETDEDTKRELRVQLQSVEVQIALKSAE